MTTLTLTRRPGQSILIGDDITIEIIRIERSVQREEVRVCIHAPAHVAINRGELGRKGMP